MQTNDLIEKILIKKIKNIHQKWYPISTSIFWILITRWIVKLLQQGKILHNLIYAEQAAYVKDIYWGKWSV